VIEDLKVSPFLVATLIFAFAGISYFMGMLLHSSFMYEDKPNMRRDSKMAWITCMLAGTGITGWMFYYGYMVNFFR
jgi:hypothetical protein